MPPMSAGALLPPDDAQRASLHNEVHARPTARVRVPALMVYVAVDNRGISREDEWAHLRRLPGQGDLAADSLQANFLQLHGEDHAVKWERHTEYTRYTVLQPLPADAATRAAGGLLPQALAVDPQWLAGLPGRTIAAIELILVEGDLPDPMAVALAAQTWFADTPVVASMLGNGYAAALSDLRIGANGFERIVVTAPAGTSVTRAGRMTQRLLELETYRVLALRGLPVAKLLSPMLADAERGLADITANLENKSSGDEALLDQLVSLAAQVERATAEHVFRFSATRAYDALVSQRLDELREKAIPGTQTLGEFMQHRLSPAMATVAATDQRLASLSERVTRTSALLRTRVDIATEAQNQQLLEKLTRGQDMQLRLQSTVEGRSIAAISYYVVSLLLYGGKALKGAGVPVNPEIAAGALIPLVLWVVWRATRRIHARLHQVPGQAA